MSSKSRGETGAPDAGAAHAAAADAGAAHAAAADAGAADAGAAHAEADLLLYSTSACHLCELAEQLLMPWAARGLRIAVEDISESDSLFERYGTTIPVLMRCDSGEELLWPFGPEEIARLVEGQ